MKKARTIKIGRDKDLATRFAAKRNARAKSRKGEKAGRKKARGK
jgi:hypothetical protein